MNWIGVAYAMGTGGTGGGQGGGGFAALVPLLLMFAIFYFLLIRPQQKKQKKHRELLGTLKRGDQVVTVGGLHGKIGRSSGDCWRAAREDHRHHREGNHLGSGRKGKGKSGARLHRRDGFPRDGAGKEVGELSRLAPETIAFGAAGSNIPGTRQYALGTIPIPPSLLTTA